LHGLAAWSGSVGLEPNLSSVVGLYASWAPATLRAILDASLVAGALVLTIREWRVRSGSIDPQLAGTAWLWLIWFLAAPFAHFPDQLILAPAILAFLGRDGVNAFTPRGVTVLSLAFLSLALFPNTLSQANLLCVFVAISALVIYRSSRAHRMAGPSAHDPGVGVQPLALSPFTRS
jgi:hypothetical protein